MLLTMCSISNVAFAILHLMTCAIACVTETSPNIATSLGTNATRFAVGYLPDLNGSSLPQSWAGQISVPGTTDDELFFWLFAAEDQAQSDDVISERSLPVPVSSAKLSDSMAQRWSWLLLTRWPDLRERPPGILWQCNGTNFESLFVDEIGECGVH